MSLIFNDLVTLKGIVQEYEDEIGVAQGTVSGSTNLLKKLTAKVNLALDDYWSIALPASGTWQMDDSNHTDYPIISTNLVSGQRDYAFTTDGSGNLILDIYKVLIADSSGVFHEAKPVDVQSERDTSSFTDGRNTTGTPYRYDKTANGIFLDPIPSYNSSGGLKVYINREPSYFSYTDTNKKPGVPGIHHRYFVLKAALDKARPTQMETKNDIQAEVLAMEASIRAYFGGRERDVRKRFTTQANNK